MIELRYSSAGEFSEGLAAVQLEPGGKWGYVDRNGKLRIRPIFDAASKFSDGLACVQRHEKWGYINDKGGATIQPQFDLPCADFSEGFGVVVVNGKYGYVDRSGEFVIKPRFDIALSFLNGVAPAYEGKRVGFVDREGGWIFPPRSGLLSFVWHGIAAVTELKDDATGDQWGYMTQDGVFLWRDSVDEEPTQEMPPRVEVREISRQPSFATFPPTFPSAES